MCPAPAPERDVARGTGLSLPAHGPSSSRGSAPGFPIPGELPPSPERPTSGSLRPSAVSARTRSSGSPTLASPPVRRQVLCNPTTLNTHPRTTCETSANRSGRYDVGHTPMVVPPVASPKAVPGAPRGKGHGPAPARTGTGSTTTGRCASRRTRLRTRGSRVGSGPADGHPAGCAGAALPSRLAGHDPRPSARGDSLRGGDDPGL